MFIHQFHHIATPQTLIWKVATQSGFGIKWQFHFVILSGTKVTNFEEPDKRSVIQMVRTRSATPFGPVSKPMIS